MGFLADEIFPAILPKFDPIKNYASLRNRERNGLVPVTVVTGMGQGLHVEPGLV